MNINDQANTVVDAVVSPTAVVSSEVSAIVVSRVVSGLVVSQMNVWSMVVRKISVVSIDLEKLELPPPPPLACKTPERNPGVVAAIDTARDFFKKLRRSLVALIYYGEGSLYS
jgi:hypothetical protein